METNPGSETTEYRIAKIAMAIGTILQPAAAGLATVWPDSKFVAIAMAIAGALIAIAGALGYQIPRAGVKTEAMRLQSIKAMANGQTANPTIPPKIDSGE